MSECVVRMKEPKNCYVCPFGLDGYIWDENDARTHYVRFCSRHSGEEYHVSETDTIARPWYCDSFICQLPEGHGRLVDADAIKLPKGFFEKVDNVPKFYEWVNSLPTIVPAERSETCLD